MSHYKSWLEGTTDHLVIESLEGDGWKHIVVNVQFEFEDEEITQKEGQQQIAYACCKRYELKDRAEPAAYNQAPPGLYTRYPYLYKVRISHETYLELTKLYLARLMRRRKLLE